MLSVDIISPYTYWIYDEAFSLMLFAEEHLKNEYIYYACNMLFAAFLFNTMILL